MGGVGFTELLLLAVVALIVLGPEKLPGIARKAGQLTRQARRAWQGLQSELQAELDADHNRRIMEATSRQEAERKSAAKQDGSADSDSRDKEPKADDDADRSD
ncbi:Sec-independent protein translocase protein TatB [Halomonas denitrificans]|nr:Sec-independent protein translocase protein TatB [Halomonas denitrificans]